MSTLDGLRLWRCRTAALLLALTITSKRAYSDTIAQRQVHDVSLEPGDRILPYSDGVVESRDEAGAIAPRHSRGAGLHGRRRWVGGHGRSAANEFGTRDLRCCHSPALTWRSRVFSTVRTSFSSPPSTA
ncbi:SpoIIE family protein phosphatase [Streptomyces iakyrus]|uniref:SpoIIE family protein phosphatase n=1 Tax=Streptomyces iakyrus TaxID=68219 RepID=UPI0036EA8FF1